MNIRSRIKALEKALKINKVYVLVDSDNIFWVNGKAYSEKEFLEKYKDEETIIKRVGFNIDKV